MAKKIEVFQPEYEYLTQFHKEATLELTELRAERDKLKQEKERLLRALAKADVRLECENCKHNKVQLDEKCEEADLMCDQCKVGCPCKTCDNEGSNWEWNGGASDGN